MKLKKCPLCKKDGDTMYRVQIQKRKDWLFVCGACLPLCQKGSFYRYGGTWKGYRH